MSGAAHGGALERLESRQAKLHEELANVEKQVREAPAPPAARARALRFAPLRACGGAPRARCAARARTRHTTTAPCPATCNSTRHAGRGCMGRLRALRLGFSFTFPDFATERLAL